MLAVIYILYVICDKYKQYYTITILFHMLCMIILVCIALHKGVVFHEFNNLYVLKIFLSY